MMALLKKLHKWVALLIGIQVFIWLGSGLVISLLDPAKVSGKHWAQAPASTRTLQFDNLLEVGDLPAAVLEGALGIDLKVIWVLPVYEINRADSITLVNAITGLPIQISERDARTLAEEDFNGDGEVISIQKGIAPDMETRDSTGPYWRVNFSDSVHSSYYISVWNGDILERRNSYWRIRDFFWMLHIMDYRGHENHNNSLIISVTLIAIWLGISGFILLFGSFNRHDFWFLNFTGKRNTCAITLIDPIDNTWRQVRLRKGSNLFLSLANHNINLPSKCGGGGECGKCRVKIEAADLAAANTVEKGLVPKRLREQNYRLACQQEVKNNITLYLPKGC